jgi:phenylalanyl-tRNA synthetase beta chain
MGGADSAVGVDTQSILLESAFFTPDCVAGRARSYGLHTDSSHRFERGVDPELQRAAMNRATSLLLDIVGGNAGPVVEVVAEDELPQREKIKLRAARIPRVLGADIPAVDVEDILTRLGMQVTADTGGWQVQAPSFRFDIEIEEDLIEEIARIYGYDQLPTTLPSSAAQMLPCTETRVAMSRLQEILVGRGYQEAITYSFVDPELQQLLVPDEEGIKLSNPISADMSVMRLSHWPGLLQALVHNVNRQQGSVKFFESGLKFLRQGADIKQEAFLSAAVTGDLLPEQWGEKARKADFFDVKGDVEALLATVSSAKCFEFKAEKHPAMHPGQTAGIYDASGQRVGLIGALHPAVETKLGVDQRVFVFEIAQKCFENAIIPSFEALSKYPAVRRDIALIVNEDVTIGELENAVKSASTGLLNNFQLFDLYQGKGIDSGRKSVAFGLTFQDQTRTLEEADVEAAMAPILAALAEQFGATLRE